MFYTNRQENCKTQVLEVIHGNKLGKSGLFDDSFSLRDVDYTDVCEVFGTVYNDSLRTFFLSS